MTGVWAMLTAALVVQAAGLVWLLTSGRNDRG